jgi:hypothetical protein
MRITELEPRWSRDANGNNGISFLCPHCLVQRLAVLVDHATPHLVNVPFPDSSNINVNQKQCWQITGDAPTFDGLNHGGFDNVSLTPSVDASEFGHWHGHITNGEIK